MWILLPPIVEKKNKRKERSKKHFSPWPKRSSHETLDKGSGAANQLFAPNLVFFKGASFSHTLTKRGAWLEIKSYALGFAKILHSEVAKGSTLEIVKLKELAVLTNNLKATLDVNLV